MRDLDEFALGRDSRKSPNFPGDLGNFPPRGDRFPVLDPFSSTHTTSGSNVCFVVCDIRGK